MAPGSAKHREISSEFLDQETRGQKYRYGAWYLPKNLWQRSLKTEELRDPKIVKAEREDTTLKREEEIVKYSTNFHQKMISFRSLECSFGSITWCQCIQRISTRAQCSSITKSKFYRIIKINHNCLLFS